MADDIDAPHEQAFELEGIPDLYELTKTLAGSSYLPMPSDAWGWTIEAEGAVIAVRKGTIGREVECLRGDPSLVVLPDKSRLLALYVRPESPWRNGDARL